jgi:hypothetical protein
MAKMKAASAAAPFADNAMRGPGATKTGPPRRIYDPRRLKISSHQCHRRIRRNISEDRDYFRYADISGLIIPSMSESAI